MLTDEEKTHIDEEVAKYPKKQYAALDALLVVQQYRGFISDDTLKDVADYLNISAAELDGVATFYNLIYRKPVGEYVVRLCDSVSCFITGYENIRAAIENYLDVSFGQTTKDKKFTLLRAQCLGTCDKAPAMMVNQNLHQNLDQNNTIEILKNYQEGLYHAPSVDEGHETRSRSSQSHGVSS
jgi:NADH-quinone oxidoreductase subunit E